MKFNANLLVILVSAAVAQGFVLSRTRPDAEPIATSCDFDYWPCGCDEGVEGVRISCLNVTATQVQSAFNRSAEANFSLLWMEGSFASLPSDLLCGKRVRQIVVKFFNPPPRSIDASVFASTGDYTTTLSMFSAEPSAVDLSFLNGFTALQSVLYLGSWTAFRSVPPLPSLNYLATNSPAFQDLLDSIAIYRDTLQYLVISGTNMSRFPPEVQSLSRLLELDLSYNQFNVLPAGSIAVSAKLSNLKLINSAVRAIEPGAFRGDFSQTEISLYFHEMTQFHELTFRDVLQSMVDANGPKSSIFLSSYHHFVCDCDLAWLLVSNRHLLDRVDAAWCTDPSTNVLYKFKDFDSTKLSSCPGVTV